MSELNISKPRTLDMWLSYIDSLNPDHIELGLNRVLTVAKRLKLNDFSDKLVIEVAGTNGKGSTCALIAKALLKHGLKVGLYTSPHIDKFNERIVIDDKIVSDDLLSEAFDYVYSNKGEIPLTYFEYTTLAAFYCFKHSNCDALVLEIGLGGRLDAVNILDADLAIITSIGLDHVHILGDTTAKIAYEKAGIIKDGKKLILGEVDCYAKAVILDVAKKKHAKVYAYGDDFDGSFTKDATIFSYNKVKEIYPLPLVPKECALLALAALKIIERSDLCPKLKLEHAKINQAVVEAVLMGRMQQIAIKPCIYLDVAHNVPAAIHLKKMLDEKPCTLRIGVLGMLKDKDVEGVCSVMASSFDILCLASLNTARGEKATRLYEALIANNFNQGKLFIFENVSLALAKALALAKSDSQIIVFGSFVTVSNAMQAYKQLQGA